MKVESVSEEILASSQNWTPDGGREHVFDNLDFFDDDDGNKEKERSSAATMVTTMTGRRRSPRWPWSRPTSGNGAVLGVDGKTGRERRGGRR